MGTRFKLRVCTWNVGNAQPPVDLSAWLGIGTDEYDIIAVGAQEANYGTEKVQSPTSISSTPSNVEALVPSNSHDISLSSNGLSVAAASSSLASRRFRKLSRVVRGATGTWRQNTVRKQKSKIGMKLESRAADNRVFAGAACNASDGESAADSSSDDGLCATKPRSSTSLPVHNSTGDLKGRMRKRQSVDHLGGSKLVNVEEFYVPIRTFDEVDDSLLVKRREGNHRMVETDAKGSPGAPEQSMDEASSGSGSQSATEREDMVKNEVEDESETEEPWREQGHVSDRLNNKSPENRQSEHVIVENGTEEGQAEEAQATQYATSRRKFSQAVEKSMPPEYHLIAKHHLMEIKLLIFVHERHKSRIVKTERVAEATGIGNVVGNKGGVAVKLTLDDTTFCFVSSHLAAHEGAKFLQQRNDDVIEIMRNIERNKVHGLPAIHQFNHVFWMGDLNYRLDLKRVLPAAVTWSHQERWCYVVDLIANRRYEDLAQLDELIHEMELEHVFGGFVEGRINFPPTFKVNRGKAYSSYQPLRVPSYCDRILWHSLPLHRNHIKLKEYSSVTDVDTSDHKPVYAVFDLVIPKPITLFPLPAPRDSLKCTMDFIKLRLHGLYEKKAEADENALRYEVLEDGALAVAGPAEATSNTGPDGTGDTAWQSPSGASHTRRVVHADFHGGGIFVKERPHRAEVPLKDGRVRECAYSELPKIALRPLRSLADLTYKYVTVVFTRLGSKQGSSCVLPVAQLVRQPGRHQVRAELDLTKYGQAVARVEVEVELVVSLETWIDTQNKVVKVRR